MAVLGPPTFALVTHSTSHSEILQAFIPFGSPRSFDVHNLKTKTYKTNRENCWIINFFKKIGFLIEKIYSETKLFVIARGKSGQKPHFFSYFKMFYQTFHKRNTHRFFMKYIPRQDRKNGTTYSGKRFSKSKN